MAAVDVTKLSDEEAVADFFEVHHLHALLVRVLTPREVQVERRAGVRL